MSMITDRQIEALWTRWRAGELSKAEYVKALTAILAERSKEGIPKARRCAFCAQLHWSSRERHSRGNWA